MTMLTSKVILVFVLSILVGAVTATNSSKESSKSHGDSKQDGKKSSAHHKSVSERKKKPIDHSDDNHDDYDTTQGYPILYPETHMSLKRNITVGNSDANATSNVSNTNTSTESNTKQEWNAAPNVNPDEERGTCSKTLDLLFLLDSSESVKYGNWKIMMEFVKNLCSRFRLNSTRVAFIRYASEAEVSIPLTQFNSSEERNAAIDNIFYKTGGTRTDIALKKAMEIFHIGEQRSQVVMLLTDGPTNRLEINKDHFVEGKDLVAAPAERLKEAGIVLFCIGIEPDSETPEEIETMKEEMSIIASEPTKQHLFMSDGYHELQRKVLSVAQAACVVNGGWSRWSEFSPCSVTCGYGTKVRMRTCTNPSPENNGADCSGPRVEVEECDLGPCKIQSGLQIVPLYTTTSRPKETTASTTDSLEAGFKIKQNIMPTQAKGNSTTTTTTTTTTGQKYISPAYPTVSSSSQNLPLQNISSSLNPATTTNNTVVPQQQQQVSQFAATSNTPTSSIPGALAKEQNTLPVNSNIQSSYAPFNAFTSTNNNATIIGTPKEINTGNSAQISSTSSNIPANPNAIPSVSSKEFNTPTIPNNVLATSVTSNYSNHTVSPLNSSSSLSKLPMTLKNESAQTSQKNSTLLPMRNSSSDTSAVNSSESSMIRNKSINAQQLKSNADLGHRNENSSTSAGISHSNIEGTCSEGFEELRLNDTQFYASSIYSHDTDDEYVKREYAPPNARLNNEINGGSWCAEHKYSTNDDKNQFLQFDLGKQMEVDAIATQGSHLLENWVKKYNLRYSDDAKSWQFYAKNPLVGNSDQNSVERNVLQPRVIARYIQINPIEWFEGNGIEPDKHDICMRAALFRCKGAQNMNAVKRGFIHTMPTVPFHLPPSSFIGNRKHGRRGVIITERDWPHLPEQKTTMTFLSVREKRHTSEKQSMMSSEDLPPLTSLAMPTKRHYKGQKRIFHRIRKIAKNIMKKIKLKAKQ